MPQFVPTPIMSGMASNNGRQCTSRVYKSRLIQPGRKEKLLAPFYKLCHCFTLGTKNLHAVLKSHVQDLFCTALPSKVNHINLI